MELGLGRIPDATLNFTVFRMLSARALSSLFTLTQSIEQTHVLSFVQGPPGPVYGVDKQASTQAAMTKRRPSIVVQVSGISSFEFILHCYNKEQYASSSYTISFQSQESRRWITSSLQNCARYGRRRVSGIIRNESSFAHELRVGTSVPIHVWRCSWIPTWLFKWLCWTIYAIAVWASLYQMVTGTATHLW
jgi:hypothetical protein